MLEKYFGNKSLQIFSFVFSLFFGVVTHAHEKLNSHENFSEKHIKMVTANEFENKDSRNTTIDANYACTLTLTSAINTDDQPVCENTPITSIVYTAGGGITGVTVSGLPTGVTGIFVAGVFTISGTPTATGVFNYTVTTVGCIPSNININGRITVIAAPNSGTDVTIYVCDNTSSAIHLKDELVGEDSGGSWAQLSGIGGTFNPMSAIFTPSVGGTTATFSYTVAGTPPCPDAVSIVTVEVYPEPDAGIDGGTLICDSHPFVIDLFSLITGEQSGGTWTQVSGTGGTFNAGAGTYSSALGATTSTFLYTVAGVPPCLDDTSLATITINPQQIAGFDGGTTICDTSATVIDLFSLITNEQLGGTWSQTTGSGGTFNATAGTFTPAIGATTSTFTYFLNGTSPCVDDESIATININQQPDAGTDGDTLVCDSSIAVIDLFSLIAGEDSGGIWTQTTGSGGTFNAGAGTYTPATGAITSTFTYTLMGTVPCINDSSIATININPQHVAGFDGGTLICDSNTAVIDLYGLITSEQTGGTWTQTTGSGGTFNASAGTFTPATGATTSTFTYFLNGTAPCVDDESIATITINPQPVAGTDGSTLICDSNTAVIDLFGLITGEDSGGTWTQTSGSGGTFNAGAGTYTPATGATTSTFTYALLGTAPCVNVSSVATININPQPVSGTDGGITICDSHPFVIDLFSLITGEQSGGTWIQTTGSGGTFNAGAGTFTPVTGATTSTFTYTLLGTAPCVDDSSVATITINPQHIAGFDGGTTICDSDTSVIDLFSLITNEQTGGVWTQTSGTGGIFNAGAGTYTPVTGATTSTFTYFLNGTLPCVDDESIATININSQPVAGTDGNTTICDSSTTVIDLFSLITGEDSGGTWAQASGAGGVFNAGAGTYTPATGATTSTFTYTLIGIAPCIDDESIATININPQPVAGTDGITTICDSNVAVIDLFSLITGEQPGGVWTQTTGSGGVFNAGAGTFTPVTGATTGTFTYTLIGIAPCIDDESIATITINPQPVAGTDGSTLICDNDTAIIDLYSLITGEDAGGTWTQASGTGGAFNSGAGTFTPATGATTSTFTYTLLGTAPCINVSSVATIGINPQPVSGTDGGTTICDSHPFVIDLYSLISGEQSGGTWTQTTGSGGTFNAGAGTFTPATGATTSTFTYTLLGTAPCIDDSSVATITINPQHIAGFDGGITICDSDTSVIDLFSLITNEQTGGVWTQTSGSGGVFNAGAGTFTPATGATTSTFSYFLNGTAPCVDDESIASININPQPVAGADGNTTVCDSSVAVIDLFSLITGEQSGGTWTQTSGSGGVFNAGAGTFTPVTGATTGTFTYTLIGAAPCIDDESLATININPQPVAGTDGSIIICDTSSSSISTIDLFSLITGEQSGGVWTQTSGSGGTFNAGAGTYTPATGATTSTFTYTLVGITPCIDDSSIATININSQPIAGTDGSTTVCDSSVAVIDLFNLITGEQTGGTWTQTSGSGGAFNAGAGTYTPATGATTSTFVYTLIGATPCIDDSSLATININPQPVAGNDASVTICDSSIAVIDLYSLITGEQPGGTWTQTSGSGGVFNAGAGTYTPATGATNSTFTYTLLGTTPCIDDSSVVSININSQPVAGTDGEALICDTSTNAIDLYSLITGEDIGGTWTQTSGAGGIFNAVAGTFTPTIGATTSTFTYSLLGTSPCVDDESMATVIINPQPICGTDGSITICDSNVSVIDLFGLITGEQSGGVWTQITGAGGVFNATAGTYTPTTGAVTCTFAYTLVGATPCIDDSSLATININTQPVAGTDGEITICDSSTNTIDLFSLISGEHSGGTWTQTSGSGGIFNAGAGTYTPATGATTSTFEYTLVGTAPCIDDSSIAVININSQPVAGADGEITICDDDTVVIDLFSLITGEQVGGTWTQTSGSGGVFDAITGTYTSVIGATTSTFEYTLLGASPCIDDSSLATITINPVPIANSFNLEALCDDDLDGINVVFDLTSDNANLLGGQTGVDITYHLTLAEATSDTNPITNETAYQNISNPQIIYVRLENGTTGCFTTTTLTLNVNVITFTPAIDLYSCDDDNDTFGYFDLNLATAQMTGVATNIVIEYYETLEEAEAGIPSAAISTIELYQNIDTDGDGVGSSQTLYINITDTTTGCSYTAETITLTVIRSPELPDGALNYTMCEDVGSADGIVAFDLTNYGTAVLLSEIDSNTVPSDYTVNYYTGLLASGNPDPTMIIVNPNGYQNTSIPDQIIYASIIHIGTGCESIVPITLHVDLLPTANYWPVFECDDDTDDGFLTFNLLDFEVGIIGGATGVEVDYYTVFEDAQIGSGINLVTNYEAFENTMNPQAIFASVYNPVTGCRAVSIVKLHINANPTPLSTAEIATNLGVMMECDGNVDGSGDISEQVAQFDLTQWEIVILTGNGPAIETGVSATYYTSIDDAEAGINAIINPMAYTNISNPQTIYVSVINDGTGLTPVTPGSGCYTIVEFEIYVPVPEISVEADKEVICVDANGIPLTNISLPELTATAGPENSAAYDYQWALNGVAISGATSQTLEVSEPGDYTVTVSGPTDFDCINVSAPLTIWISGVPDNYNVSVTTNAFADSHQIVAVATSNTPGIVFWYSLDGGEPTTNGTFDNVVPGIHHITISDGHGCWTRDETVTIIDYPQFFTPNGDGINDTWAIIGQGEIPISQIYIFDRFGKLLKQLDPDSKGWTGIYNGSQMPATDYWFKITYLEGDENVQKEFQSHFSLKR